MLVSTVSTLQFPSDRVQFDWESIKKMLHLTDVSFNSFKDSAIYVKVCLQLPDENWDDEYHYGVSNGLVWQDTQQGLPDFSCEDIRALILRILKDSSMSNRNGVLEFKKFQIRWEVKSSALIS